MNFIGIDVGLTGAVGIVENGTIYAEEIKTAKMLEGAYNTWYNADYLLERFRSLQPFNAIVEYQRPMSKQGVTTMFRLGRGFGLLEGLIASTANSYALIDPKQWQNYFIKKYLTKEEILAFKEKTKDIEYIKTQLNECEFKDFYVHYSSLKSASLTKLRSMYIYHKMSQVENLPLLKNHNMIDALLLVSFSLKYNFS
jgi:hypothetical protein